jgi:chemotaxis protein methyltransferase CheR
MSSLSVRVAAIDDYVDFCEGIKKLTGLDLLQYKRAQMERRLRSFAERMGSPLLGDYLTVLQRDPSELDRFLDRVTINVSQLWRNPEQWTALSRHVVPELAKEGRIRVWSAGCSYGAECYTVAAVCLESAGSARVTVKGTDIDTRVLARAERGHFSEEDARDAPAASLKRWFEHTETGWNAGAELHRVVSFERGDLLAMPVRTGAYDLVMCRNVVIYFTEDVRDSLHARLASSLRSGGYLVVGSTERITAAGELGLTLAHPFIYRKA